MNPRQLRLSLFAGVFFVAAIAWFSLGNPAVVGIGFLAVAAITGTLALLPPRR